MIAIPDLKVYLESKGVKLAHPGPAKK